MCVGDLGTTPMTKPSIPIDERKPYLAIAKQVVDSQVHSGTQMTITKEKRTEKGQKKGKK
jgi:hypothetical protein